MMHAVLWAWALVWSGFWVLGLGFRFGHKISELSDMERMAVVAYLLML